MGWKLFPTHGFFLGAFDSSKPEKPSCDPNRLGSYEPDWDEGIEKGLMQPATGGIRDLKLPEHCHYHLERSA
jgi:hypothetical protein